MGIVIEKIILRDGNHDQHFCLVNHNGQSFTAVVVGAYDLVFGLLGGAISAEYELNEIVSVEANLLKDDQHSGIFSLSDNRVLIDGTVHDQISIDANVSLFDIYIANGADFLNIRSELLPIPPKIDSRIQITGRGLYVYPINT